MPFKRWPLELIGKSILKIEATFKELLDLASNHDSVMKTKLPDGPKNAVYTSHGIQEEDTNTYNASSKAKNYDAAGTDLTESTNTRLRM